MNRTIAATAVWFSACACHLNAKPPLQSSDFYKLQSVADVAYSPDASRIAYAVVHHDTARRPYSRLNILTTRDGASSELGSKDETASGPVWSPDGHWIAFEGTNGKDAGVFVVRSDGTGPRLLARAEGTNSRLPETGNRIAWSPDSRRIAFLSALPGPETAEAAGDPMVITRYLYRPDAAEGSNPFGDNRRLHIFIADLGNDHVAQLTNGAFHEHSIDWSPRGDEILFISNREPDADRFFNNDVFTVRVGDGVIRRLTSTENSEYRPRWSPDGRSIVYQATRRGITYLDAFMEDTHVWTMESSGNNPRELGGRIDNRQGAPSMDPEGRFIYFTVEDRGNVRLCRMPSSGGEPDVIVKDTGAVESWSVARGGHIAYAFSGASDTPELYSLPPGGSPKPLTSLNAGVLADRALGQVEAFTFPSHDHLFEIEAFLTKPAGFDPALSYPLVVSIHGGPHGQQGPAFQFRNQVYAGRGWATLMVNYRGSTGYGQLFANGIFGDQHGNEAQDVLYGVSAALRRNLWLDRDRVVVEGGSYGGGICEWLITQTSLFKAAVSIAGITNPITYNYRTNNNQYVHMAFGSQPHQQNLMDRLWERSPLRYVARARTPILLMHGENDSDVPIAETEQFYIALRDVGVPAVMVRYPREGHGFREVRHIVDSIDRSIEWFAEYLAEPNAAPPGPVPHNGSGHASEAGRR